MNRIILSTLFLLGGTTLVACDRQESVSEEAREAVESIGDGADRTAAQAEDVVQAIGNDRTPVEKALDRRISALERWIEDQQDAVSDAGDAAGRKALESFEARVADVRADLQEMSDETDAALDKAKADIEKRIDALEASTTK